MAQPDAWSELAYISIAKQSGVEQAFQAATETIDIDFGDKAFDTIATLSGGRLVKFTPTEDTTITMELYPTQVGTLTAATAGTGVFDLMGMTTYSTVEPQRIQPERTRVKYRVAILWTDKTGANAYDTIASTTNTGVRVVAADGYFISVRPSFTDGVLKFTVKFKVPPFDNTGTANILVESVMSATTAYTLSILASYTSAMKFRTTI